MMRTVIEFRNSQEVGFHFDKVSSVVYGTIVDLTPRVPHQRKSTVTFSCVILSYTAEAADVSNKISKRALKLYLLFRGIM